MSILNKDFVYFYINLKCLMFFAIFLHFNFNYKSSDRIQIFIRWILNFLNMHSYWWFSEVNTLFTIMIQVIWSKYSFDSEAGTISAHFSLSLIQLSANYPSDNNCFLAHLSLAQVIFSYHLLSSIHLSVKILQLQWEKKSIVENLLAF